MRVVPGEQQVGRLRVAVSIGPLARTFEADPPPGLFNLDVHIHDVESGRPVPYLDVRSDVSRNGAPVLSKLEMVPVVSPAAGVAGIRYGNNVALEEGADTASWSASRPRR